MAVSSRWRERRDGEAHLIRGWRSPWSLPSTSVGGCAGGGLAEPRLRLDRERVRSPWTRAACRPWRASPGKAAVARRPRSAPTGGSTPCAGETLFVSRRRPAACSTRARAMSRSPAAMSCFTRRILSRTKSRHRFSRPRQRGRAAGCHNRGWRRSSDRSSGVRRRTPAACSMLAATRQSRSRAVRSRCSRSPSPRSSRRDPGR